MLDQLVDHLSCYLRISSLSKDSGYFSCPDDVVRSMLGSLFLIFAVKSSRNYHSPTMACTSLPS